VAQHELDALLVELARSELRFVILGGIAVGVHGYVRATRDVDICPAPSAANLDLLAWVLAELEAEPVEVGELAQDELACDPLDPADLALGGNFRLRTRLGALDLMQWISGIEAEHAFQALDEDAIDVDFEGQTLRVCSLRKLRLMKQAAGRPQDLLDLEHLPQV
jgi:hypothetical protein